MDVVPERDLGEALLQWIRRNPRSPLPNFAAQVRRLSGVSEGDARLISKLVLGRFGGADAGVWENLLRWFGPLHAGERPAVIEASNRHWYYVSDLLSLLRRRDFHAFASTDDVKERLLTLGQGAYLFRFSSSPGSFALSVCGRTTVHHWRLSFEKRGSMSIHLDGKITYQDFDEVVTLHATKVPLTCAPPGCEKILLVRPCVRPSSRPAVAPHQYGNIQSMSRGIEKS